MFEPTRLLALALAVPLVACSSPKDTTTTPTTTPTATPTTPPEATAGKDDAVLEAVLRHEIGAAGVTPDEAICIVLRNTSDATTANVIAALKRTHPTTVADGECQGGGPTGPVTLTATGGKAVRFDVGPVQWVSETQTFVDGGGGHRGGGVAERRYTLEKTADGWKVTAEKPGLTT